MPLALVGTYDGSGDAIESGQVQNFHSALAHNGILYLMTSQGVLVRYNDNGTFTPLTPALAGIQPGQNWKLFIHDGQIHAVRLGSGNSSIYRWNGSSSFASLSGAVGLDDVTSHNGEIFGTAFSNSDIARLVGAFWPVYCVGTFNGDLLSWNGGLHFLGTNGLLQLITAGSATTVAAAVASYTSADNPIGNHWVVHNGELYYSVTQSSDTFGLGKLFKFNGASWVSLVPASGPPLSSLISALGTIYGFQAGAVGGSFYKWDGAASFSLVATAAPSTWFVASASLGSRGFVTRYPYQLYEITPDIPSLVEILPGSTAKISHARIIRAHRGPERAEEFHDLTQRRL